MGDILFGIGRAKARAAITFTEQARANGLRDAYPAQPDGKTLLTYPRLFIAAVRS